jgi:hypothetical protein
VRATTGPYTGDPVDDQRINDFVPAAHEGSVTLHDRDPVVVLQNILSFLVYGVSTGPVWRGHWTALPITGGWRFMTKDEKFKTVPDAPEDWKQAYTNVETVTIICGVVPRTEVRSCTFHEVVAQGNKLHSHLHMFQS